MRPPQAASGRGKKGILILFALICAIALLPLIHRGAHAATQSQGKLEATIFSFDGKEFVRTKSTLMTQEGKSAVNTKLEHDSPAYSALLQKHSYTGDATVFGKKYEANYAPLTGADGKVTGALFVAVAK
ncbi:MAG TPA: Cache 3/Cache 2 fusion domain-containing protein [Gemmatimonadales bacterium]|nr:Cache 3/Cache 2 fusion domain-containing protein [Gemmatimonadales bacterium]